MYVPDAFKGADVADEMAVIDGNPLALFVTTTSDGPVATHAPIIFPPELDRDALAGLTGCVLLGHMNARNPQWLSLVEGDQALVVFHGPNGYVSPAVYEVSPAAPTWNFTSVHLRCSVHKLAGGEETLRVVRATAGQLESRFGKGWEMAESLDYFARIAVGVGAFELRVQSAQSMFKLSQEQSPRRQQLVVDWFESTGTGLMRQTAELMRGLGLGTPVGDRSR